MAGEDEPGLDALDADAGPTRTGSIIMMVVGAVFLLPFVFVAAAEPTFGGLVGAFLTVGWTLGLGLVFLVFGWKRLRERAA